MSIKAEKQQSIITRNARETLNNHTSCVVWLTGLSGAGKTTIATSLERRLYEEGKRTYILDGDNLRLGLNQDLGFTKVDRIENVRRVAEVSRLMCDAGLITIAALISPFQSERLLAKELIEPCKFIEVFVDTPLDICEQRDAKGLYEKARKGIIKDMTGIDSPYEPPTNPDCIIPHGMDIESAVSLVKNLIP
jgi:bifunctional enzyme CysN/CysC